MANYEQDSKIQFVIDAVYAFAYALDALKSAVCPTWKGVCPAMSSYDGGEFYKKYLLAVDFKGKFILIECDEIIIFLSRKVYRINTNKIICLRYVLSKRASQESVVKSLKMFVSLLYLKENKMYRRNHICIIF